MDLSEISKFAEAQDAGSWHELRHPVDGKPTGIRVLVVGPDSRIARKVSGDYQTALQKLPDRRGIVDAGKAADLYVEHLARLVLEMEATEDGEPVPSTPETVLRLMRAGRWIERQVAAFAETRMPYSAGLGEA